MKVIDFKEAKCKNCYKCIRTCAVKAIEMKNEHAQIIEDQCILCGRCLEVCPQNAKTFHSDIDMVKQFLREGERVVASLAPSYMVGMRHQHPGQIVGALKKLGFMQVRETSEGAAYVTEEYRHLIAEGRMHNIISSCCPSVNELIELYYPKQIDALAPVVSPMIAHGRLLRAELGQNIKVVFVGPCIAKKREAEVDRRTSGAVDAVIDFTELEEWLEQEQIDVFQCEPGMMDNRNPRINRLYPVNGGIVAAVEAGGVEQSYRKVVVHGLEDCVDFLKSMEKGEINGCFVEMSICHGSCIEGPAIVRDRKNTSRFKKKLTIEESVQVDQALPKDFIAPDGVIFYRSFQDRSIKENLPTETEIRQILRKIGKMEEKDELNCGSCGYSSCREKAIAVYQGKAELSMCLPYMHAQAQSMARLVLEKGPNLIVMVDHHLQIQELSKAAQQCFGKTNDEVKNLHLRMLIDTADFQQVQQTHENIYNKKVYYPKYERYLLQDIVYLEEQDGVLGIFQDITDIELKKKQDNAVRLETVEMAQNVINKQMTVAQQIAELMGETTAETKVTLTKLRKMVLADLEEE